MKTQIISTPFRDIKIHTLISPEETFEVTTQIIETKEKLVVIDAQFFLPYAYEVAAFVKALNKPVECIIITHAHPDHWMGLEAFEQYPILSIPEVSAEIEKGGDFIIEQVNKFNGDITSSKKIVPQPTLKPGAFTLVGINMELEHISGAEGTHHILLKLPDYRVLIAQDLAYNKVHLFIGGNCLDNWITLTNCLYSDEYYEYIFCGHGKPGTKNIFNEMANYLRFAKNALISGANADELIKKLVKEYPHFKSPHLIQISADYIFLGEHKVD